MQQITLPAPGVEPIPICYIAFGYYSDVNNCINDYGPPMIAATVANIAVT